MSRINISSLNLEEKVISINRCAKVVKGGRRFSFSALCVVGDKQGHVGIGSGKAGEIPSAIRKAIDKAKKNLIYIDLVSTTIPFPINAKSCASRVILKPAPRGSGIVAGGTVRAIMELVGIKDVLTKSIGSTSPSNIASATIKCLQEIKKSYDVKRYRLGKKEPSLVTLQDNTPPPTSDKIFDKTDSSDKMDSSGNVDNADKAETLIN